MGLDQKAYVYLNKRGQTEKQRIVKFEWRNNYELHSVIEEEWSKRGSPGKNVYGQENPKQLIDMGVELQLSDIQSLSIADLCYNYEKENNDFIKKAAKAISEDNEVLYFAS